MAGITALKTVLTTVGDVGVKIIQLGKDGFQGDDIGEFLNDDKIVDSVLAAIKAAGQIPAEVVDIDFFEGISLARHGYAQFDRIIDELKKK